MLGKRDSDFSIWFCALKIPWICGEEVAKSGGKEQTNVYSRNGKQADERVYEAYTALLEIEIYRQALEQDFQGRFLSEKRRLDNVIKDRDERESCLFRHLTKMQ